MAKPIEYTSWPLSEPLTRKVVSYLNVYRIIVAVMLGIAHFGGLVNTGANPVNLPLAGVALLAYLLFAVFHLFSARRKGADYYRLAAYSLITDIVILSLLVIAYGGVSGGVGILLVFTSGVAAVLLPLRLALLLASIASLTMIGTAAWHLLAGNGSGAAMIQAGMFGVTAMVAAVLANLLAYWARDFRLIAEKRKETLTELEQVNELIIRRMRTGVVAVDQTNLIRVMNESAWFLLGSPPVRQRSLRSLSPRLEQALGDWKKNPTAEPRPVVLEPSQAQILPAFVSLPSETGLGSMVFLNDNNVVARRAIELSVNSLAKLSGSIAHEIRNPLAAVSHAAQLLDESEDLPEGERRLVDIIRKQSRRMNGIVENILQLSRREKSRPELFELTAWLEELMDEFRGSLSQDELELVLDNGEPPVMVMFDRSQLHQALWKLMENAVQHAGGAGHAPRVVLRLERREQTGHCLVNVEDNGPGIPEDRIGNIFEPFYTTRQEGSGLGLYVARQLCEANQAVLTVDSSAKLGTRFHLRLATVRDAGDAQVAAATVEQEVS
jgi:two-component system sensor histidine kinase PilS (NtrC family)